MDKARGETLQERRENIYLDGETSFYLAQRMTLAIPLLVTNIQLKQMQQEMRSGTIEILKD